MSRSASSPWGSKNPSQIALKEQSRGEWGEERESETRNRSLLSMADVWRRQRLKRQIILSLVFWLSHTFGTFRRIQSFCLKCVCVWVWVCACVGGGVWVWCLTQVVWELFRGLLFGFQCRSQAQGSMHMKPYSFIENMHPIYHISSVPRTTSQNFDHKIKLSGTVISDMRNFYHGKMAIKLLYKLYNQSGERTSCILKAQLCSTHLKNNPH